MRIGMMPMTERYSFEKYVVCKFRREDVREDVDIVEPAWWCWEDFAWWL